WQAGREGRPRSDRGRAGGGRKRRAHGHAPRPDSVPGSACSAAVCGRPGAVRNRARTPPRAEGIMREPMDGPIVQARRLPKVYRGAGEVEALRGIDVEVGRGEMVAVVGPSGSGKTTLLNCLSGLDSFDGGQVSVDGQDLSTMSDRTRTAYRRDHMGFVFQAFNLLPVLSAVENVAIPLLLQNVSSRD